MSVTLPEGEGVRRPGPLDSALSYCRHRARRSCTRKVLYKRVPVLGWLPRYTGEAVVSDLVAGVTVGLTVIPQGIAYATVAGIPPQVRAITKFSIPKGKYIGLNENVYNILTQKKVFS